MGRQSWKTWKIEKCKKIKFKKIVKNRKKQNFTDLTQNPVTTFLLSKRKHSWLFFEIGIENGFLGGTFQKNQKMPKKNAFFSRLSLLNTLETRRRRGSIGAS